MDGPTQAARSRSADAYAQLRQMILGGTLPSGTVLRERAFAERLGVSRTPLREAITRLAAEGLVSRDAQGNPTVARISVTEVIEILHVRTLLECDAARQAATVRSTPEDWLRLRSTAQAFAEGQRPTPDRHAEFDFDLHMLIARTAGSTLQRDMIAGLKRKTRIYDKAEIPARFEPGAREHLAIIDAILAGDPEASEAAMRQHIENARKAILSHVASPG